MRIVVTAVSNALVLAFLLLPATSMADGLLNANDATAEQMAGLPHLDEFLVKAIIDNRPYVTISALHELLGADLDDAELEDLYGRLFVPLNLNKAARSEILLIPGVGDRMAHEFEEYRPYSNLEQFRREIGKYVDQDEVARLEQYVTLN